MVTVQQIQAIMPKAGDKADLYAGPLNAAFERFGINDPLEQAAFLAQIAHESGQLRHVREIWGPTQAQESYEDRKGLGNIYPGDGHKFMGRGLIQLTGRDNYARCSTHLFGDSRVLTDQPELLEKPEYAALSAGWFWFVKSCGKLVGDFRELTKRINGGYNGLADREAFFAVAQKVMVPRGSVQTPPPIPEQPRKPMAAPLLLALAPMLAELIPQIAKLFSSGSEVSTRNVAAVEAVAKTVVAATGSTHVAEAIEKMQADPILTAQVQQAIVTDPEIIGLLEIGGGINKAREADQVATNAERPFWFSPAFWAFVMLLPLLYIVVVAVTFNVGKDWSDEMRSVVVTAIVTGLLGSLTGFYFGSSYGSQKKTDIARV